MWTHNYTLTRRHMHFYMSILENSSSFLCICAAVSNLRSASVNVLVCVSLSVCVCPLFYHFASFSSRLHALPICLHRCAYPSLRSLGSWFLNLVLRIDALNDWQKQVRFVCWCMLHTHACMNSRTFLCVFLELVCIVDVLH